MSKSPIEMMLDGAIWVPCERLTHDDELPHVTHTGHFVVGEIRIDCVSPNNGHALITEDSMDRLFPGWRDLCPHLATDRVQYRNQD